MVRIAGIVVVLALGAGNPSPESLVRDVERGKCGAALASGIDAARGKVARNQKLARRLSRAAALAVQRCDGDRLGESTVYQGIHAVAQLGPATCDDARAVREVALRTNHPSRAYLASAIQNCETGGTPVKPRKAKVEPASRQERKLTRKALGMPCSSTVAERKLLLNRWSRLPAEERVGKLQELVDRCAAEKAETAEK